VLLTIAVWALMYWGTDRWWAATTIAFGPRWVWLLPLLVLTPWAIAARQRKRLRPLAIGFALCLTLVMGFRISFGGGLAVGEGAPKGTLRVMTLNVHRAKVDVVALEEYIRHERPQVIVFQDWSDSVSPALPNRNGWHVRRDGELYVASQFPIAAAEDLHLADLGDGTRAPGRHRPGNAVH
jgi:hypothetical protein